MSATVAPTAALRQLIAGAWQSGSGTRVQSFSPTSPDVIVAEGESASAGDVDDAVRAARQAQPEWAATPMHQRGAFLATAATIIERNATEWGRELTREEGKTVSEGIAEVGRAAQIRRFQPEALRDQAAAFR